MKRKENSETCKGKNIFCFIDVVAIKKKKKEKNREYIAFTAKKNNVELSKQVNAPAEIIWSDGRVLHISARAHTAKKDKQHFCCRQYGLVRNAK